MGIKLDGCKNGGCDFSMEKIIRTAIRGKALCIFENGSLLCYQGGIFKLYDTLNGYSLLHQFSLPNKKFYNTLSKVRILERLFHCEARWAVPINSTEALISTNTGIYCVNCKTGIHVHESVSVQGKPLAVTVLQGIAGFDDSIVVGDYTLNPEREPVSLYQRDVGGNWHCAYTFPANTVRHVHSVFADWKTQKVYILTGDNDSESGIWVAEDNFKTVKPLLVGSQQYRACQMIAQEDLILYMTDAPSEKNAIYQVVDGRAEMLAELEGTCIYGAVGDGIGVFSTTCEPDAHAKNRLDYWLSNKPGKGIDGRCISVFTLTSDGTKECVARFEHDGLPLRLFQYGTVTFTNTRDGMVYFTPHCVKHGAEWVYCLNLR